MHTAISPTSAMSAADAPRRRRNVEQTRLIAPGITTQVLPQRVGAAASIWGPKWLFIAGGAVLGGLLFSIPGAVLGGLAGYLLTR